MVAGDEEARGKSVQYVKDTVTMVKELEGYEVSIVPGEVGKVMADSTAGCGVAVGRGRDEGDPRARPEGGHQARGRADRTGSRPTSSPAPTRRRHWPMRSAPRSASASTPSTSTSRRPTLTRRFATPATGSSTSTSPTTTGSPAGWGSGTGAGWSTSCARSATTARSRSSSSPRSTAQPANPFPDAIETDPVDVSPEQKKFIEDHGSDLLSEKFYSSLVERCAQELLPLSSRRAAEGAQMAQRAVSPAIAGERLERLRGRLGDVPVLTDAEALRSARATPTGRRRRSARADRGLVADAVVRPRSAEEVASALAAAAAEGVPVVPRGGGSGSQEARSPTPAGSSSTSADSTRSSSSTRRRSPCAPRLGSRGSASRSG